MNQPARLCKAMTAIGQRLWCPESGAACDEAACTELHRICAITTASSMRENMNHYQVVPTTPTEEMLVAALKELDPVGELVDWRNPDCTSRADVRLCWSAMLGADFDARNHPIASCEHGIVMSSDCWQCKRVSKDTEIKPTSDDDRQRAIAIAKMPTPRKPPTPDRWAQWEEQRARIEDLERQVHGMASTLCDCAILIDNIKVEWQPTGDWSAWDQLVRDRISAHLVAIAAAKEN